MASTFGYGAGTLSPANIPTSYANGDMVDSSIAGAASPNNLMALLLARPDLLRQLGYSGSTDVYSATSGWDNPGQPGQGMTDLQAWLEANNYGVRGDLSSNGMRATLTDSAGNSLLSESTPNDKSTALAAALMVGGFGGATALGVGAGGLGSAGADALGIPGASYALPGAETGFGVANTGALGAGGGTVGGGLVAPTVAGTAGIGAGLGTAGAGAGVAAGSAPLLGGTWGSILTAAAPLVGGIFNAYATNNAASKAAGAQTAAAQAGIDQQNQQFAAIQKLLAPYSTAGAGAIGAQSDLVGLNGSDAQGRAIAGIQSSPQFTSALKQGESSILANASATGGLRGGNTQAALAQFSPQLLAQMISDQYSKLGGLTSVGQNAAAGVGNAGMATGNNVTNLLGQVGSAQAGQAIAGGRANVGLANGFLGSLGMLSGLKGF